MLSSLEEFPHWMLVNLGSSPHSSRSSEGCSSSRLPCLQALHSTQQVNMTGRVLFNHIFYIIGTQGFAKLASRYKVFDLSKCSNCVLVCLCKDCEFHLLVWILICARSIWVAGQIVCSNKSRAQPHELCSHRLKANRMQGASFGWGRSCKEAYRKRRRCYCFGCLSC